LAAEEFMEKYRKDPGIIERADGYDAVIEQIVENMNEWKKILDEIKAARGEHKPYLKVVS
jgi:hypothetical protein